MKSPTNVSARGLVPWAIVLLTAWAPAAGGSASLWAEASLTIGTGLLFLFAPARKSLGLLPNLAFGGLLALALVAFLPAHWFPIPAWRSDLTRIGVELPATITAQPWLTFAAVLSLLLGLSWTYYLFNLDWSLEARLLVWVAMACLIVALSGALTTSFVLQKHIPFWPDVPEFGFSPNRNHTSNVLGLGGILVYALALRGLDEGQKTWWIWLAALSLICWALILNFSRAGIILLCGGALVWHSYWLVTSQPGHRRPLIGYGAIVLVVAVFIWDGGKTAMRFVNETADFFSPTRGRFGIYRDALHLSLKSPITGIGLRNFAAIFTTNQHFSAGPDVAIHPESDWIWSAVELGWLSPLLIAFIFGWWLTRCFPFEPRTLRLMRMAAFICGCGFALHAFFDVPGHRIGSLWPALLVASTAMHPGLELDFSKLVSAVFRVLGILFVAVGLWWFASILDANVWLPTQATLSRSLEEIDNANTRQDYKAMLAQASNAIRVAPLNWELYFKRGVAEAALYHPRSEIARDFAAARYLLSNWPDLYLKEGMIWLGVGEPDLAFATWEEGMQKLPAYAADMYSDVFGVIKSDVEMRERWRQLADNNKQCLLIFLSAAENSEFQIELQQLVAGDEQLRLFGDDDLKRLFALWYKKGDKLWLAEILQKHPEWKKLAWRQLAWSYADYQDYRQAFETASVFLPHVDHSRRSESTADADLAFSSNPTDADAGIALALALASDGKIDAALSTVLTVRALPDAPKSLPVLEARLWAEKKEWQKAWMAVAPLVPAP